MPVLGLIFLRNATTRFNDLLPEVEKAVPSRATLRISFLLANDWQIC